MDKAVGGSYIYDLLNYFPILEYISEYRLVSLRCYNTDFLNQFLCRNEPQVSMSLEHFENDSDQFIHFPSNSFIPEKERHHRTTMNIKYSSAIVSNRRRLLNLKKSQTLHLTAKELVEEEVQSRNKRPRVALRDNIDNFFFSALVKLLRLAGILFEEVDVFTSMKRSITACYSTICRQIKVVADYRRLDIVGVISCDDVLTALNLLNEQESTSQHHFPTIIYGHGVAGNIQYLL